MKIGRLFEDREWYIDSRKSRGDTITGVSCRGNYFQMIHALFRFMTRTM